MAGARLTRPNILVIFSDSHTAAAAGCYGSEIVRTPSLDKLAAEGVIFERAYCQNPLCLPSRQSFITGKYSCQTGVFHNDQPMPDIYTMGHHFAKSGYETTAFGKMHFIPDTEMSFGKERRYGFERRIDYEEFWQYLRTERGCAPVPGQPDDPYRLVHLEHWQHILQFPKVKRETELDPMKDCLQPGVLPHEDHQEALVLRTWKDFLERPRQKPFFAFVSFQSPHAPYIPPDNFLKQYAGRIPVPGPPGEGILCHPIWRKRVKRADIASPGVIEKHLRSYYAFISYTDWCVGEALRTLEAAGHREDTLVCYVSDHGDMGLVHGLYGKCVFFEPSVRVPLIMRMPGNIPAGWRYDGLVELVDLFPTFCQTAGVAFPNGLVGRSLWDDLRSQSGLGKAVVFSESYPMLRTQRWMGPKPHRMILTDRWKLVQCGDICAELFDVIKDPLNENNLAEDPVFRSMQKQLLGVLEERVALNRSV